MHSLRIVPLLLMMVVIDGAPLASIHVKFTSEPHSYEHGLTTDGGNTVAQKSYLSVGRRSPHQRISRQFGSRFPATRNIQLSRQHPYDNSLKSHLILPINAESLWPVGVFVPPVDVNDLGYSSGDHVTPDFSDGLAHPDPLLLTGDAAEQAVRRSIEHGELFYHDVPHDRALLRNQEERRLNGLHGNILSSLRPESPFYRHPTDRRRKSGNHFSRTTTNRDY